MSAPQGDDLERRLAELFQQRAATVTQARRVDLDSGDSDRKATSTQPRRFGTPRENLGLLAVAAVVLVALAGTVQGIREFHQWQLRTAADVDYGPSPKPSASGAAPSTRAWWPRLLPGGKRSTPAPSRWTEASTA